ncbi:MAG TPA: Rad52/Rad22 family DNA repair protein, partial [Candidatus Methylomirabilis sp.]|nr:Rad52/Rad22 family DNA repair protein [Candidatus Methylomirabilis sp.]
MAFSVKQVRALKRKPDHRHVRTRHAHDGRELTYLEGWYAISEANRIFGFDGWSRETVESRCVLARENKGIFLAVYIARVRLTVQADGTSIIREGHGSGEGRGISPGEVHDIALKAAETDATKRALATFGKPFGLELYRGGKATSVAAPRLLPALPAIARNEPGHMLNHETQTASVPNQQVGASAPVGFHPDDTTPIPRPSRFYGRRQDLVTHERAQGRRSLNAAGRPLVEDSIILPLSSPTLVPAPIDKSLLALAEPKRLRDKAHLKFVATQSCLVCGRQPSDPHHLRFTQPRAIGLKVSDEFTVPLCRGHHRELHQTGNEPAWWE